MTKLLRILQVLRVFFSVDTLKREPWNETIEEREWFHFHPSTKNLWKNVKQSHAEEGWNCSKKPRERVEVIGKCRQLENLQSSSRYRSSEICFYEHFRNMQTKIFNRQLLELPVAEKVSVWQWHFHPSFVSMPSHTWFPLLLMRSNKRLFLYLQWI